MTARIPFLRPSLPILDRCAHLLKRIDECHLYSNGGLLSCPFEQEVLAAAFRNRDGLCAATNATFGLMTPSRWPGAPGAARSCPASPSRPPRPRPSGPAWCPGSWTWIPPPPGGPRPAGRFGGGGRVPCATFGAALDLASCAERPRQGIPGVVEAAASLGILAGAGAGPLPFGEGSRAASPAPARWNGCRGAPVARDVILPPANLLQNWGMLFESPSTFGRAFRILTFGESHGPAVGVVLDGVKPGLPFDLAAIQHELDRRRPGQSELVTPRQETDRVQVLSGVFEGRTTGHPIALVVFNENQRSSDYAALADLFRPGHADLTYQRKYGLRDPRGGGRSSGRETLARVAAGAWAKQQLAGLGVAVRGFNREVAGIAGSQVDWSFVESNPLRVGDPDAFPAQRAAVESARAEGDSVGGVCEVWIEGLPEGLGDPAFGKLDALLAAACMSIGAVKGVELGAGFESARRRGSENNDPLGPDGPLKNDAGGTLGGISTGATVVVRLAVKPTSSIARTQRTIDREGRAAEISTRGRHDPCIAPRIVPVAEAMCALVVYDAWLTQQELREDGPTRVPEWDWEAVEAAVRAIL